MVLMSGSGSCLVIDLYVGMCILNICRANDAQYDKKMCRNEELFKFSVSKVSI